MILRGVDVAGAPTDVRTELLQGLDEDTGLGRGRIMLFFSFLG
jgi:hypothetical protein